MPILKNPVEKGWVITVAKKLSSLPGDLSISLISDNVIKPIDSPSEPSAHHCFDWQQDQQEKQKDPEIDTGSPKTVNLGSDNGNDKPSKQASPLGS